MMVGYKDKEGNIHVESVSEIEGERINREVASMGYATPPGPRDETKMSQEWVERKAHEENQEITHVGHSEIEVASAVNEEDMTMGEYQHSPLRARDLADAHDKLDAVEIDTTGVYDEMKLDTFLFHDIKLSREKFSEVEIRLLRQVCWAFYGIRFDRKMDQIALAEPISEDTVAEQKPEDSEAELTSEEYYKLPPAARVKLEKEGKAPIEVPPMEVDEADKESTELASTARNPKIDLEEFLDQLEYHPYMEVKYADSFPRGLFMDILFNCVRGKGSIMELLSLALFLDASEHHNTTIEYFKLFHEESISFESFKQEVPDETFATYHRLCNPHIREVPDDATIRRYERKGIPHKSWIWNDRWTDTMNVMVEKVYFLMNPNWLNLAPVLINLPEKDWKASILTDDFFNIGNK